MDALDAGVAGLRGLPLALGYRVGRCGGRGYSLPARAQGQRQDQQQEGDDGASHGAVKNQRFIICKNRPVFIINAFWLRLK